MSSTKLDTSATISTHDVTLAMSDGVETPPAPAAGWPTRDTFGVVANVVSASLQPAAGAPRLSPAADRMRQAIIADLATCSAAAKPEDMQVCCTGHVTHLLAHPVPEEYLAILSEFDTTGGRLLTFAETVASPPPSREVLVNSIKTQACLFGLQAWCAAVKPRIRALYEDKKAIALVRSTWHLVGIAIQGPLQNRRDLGAREIRRDLVEQHIWLGRRLGKLSHAKPGVVDHVVAWAMRKARG